RCRDGREPCGLRPPPGAVRGNRLSPWDARPIGDGIWLKTKEAAPVGSPLTLLGEFDDTGLADHRHLDLARIAELAFDAFCDIAGEDLGPTVVDRVRLDDDADLPTRLDRERFLHAFEGVGDA